MEPRTHDRPIRTDDGAVVSSISAARPAPRTRPTSSLVLMLAPAALASSAIASATSPKSTIAVAGEWSAAIPLARGSIARSSDPPNAVARHPVRARSLLKRIESCHLALVGRDHELPALVVAIPRSTQNASRATHHAAQARLQRSRRIVETSMDDARVVTSLVLRQHVLLLQHQDLRVPALSSDQPSGGQPEDPATDDHDPHTLERKLSERPPGTRRSPDSRFAGRSTRSALAPLRSSSTLPARRLGYSYGLQAAVSIDVIGL